MADHDRLSRAREKAERVIERIGTVLLDKNHEVRLAMTCLLARGHLLIEDLPGVGKTLLARTIAATLGLDFRRIQFTSDLLPADVIGGHGEPDEITANIENLGLSTAGQKRLLEISNNWKN